jgi:hypothetical protein
MFTRTEQAILDKMNRNPDGRSFIEYGHKIARRGKVLRRRNYGDAYAHYGKRDHSTLLSLVEKGAAVIIETNKHTRHQSSWVIIHFRRPNPMEVLLDLMEAPEAPAGGVPCSAAASIG